MRDEACKSARKTLSRRGFLRAVGYGMAGAAMLGSTGCSLASGGDISSGTTVLRAGHAVATDAPYDRGLRRLAELVREKTGGAVEVEVYANAELGGETDLIQGMQTGNVDLAVVGAGPVSAYIAAGGLMNLPFLITSREQRLRILREGVLSTIERRLEDSVNVSTLDYFGGGARHLIFTQAADSLDQAEGRVLRVQPSPFMSEAWSALGLTPATISYGEMYNALQQGVADGAENETVLILTQNFYEPAPYMLLSQHETAIRPLQVSNQTLQRLPEDQREAVREAATEAADYEYDVEVEADEESLKTLTEDRGVEASEVDVSEPVEILEPLWRRYASDWGVTEELERMMEARSQ